MHNEGPRTFSLTHTKNVSFEIAFSQSPRCNFTAPFKCSHSVAVVKYGWHSLPEKPQPAIWAALDSKLHFQRCESTWKPFPPLLLLLFRFIFQKWLLKNGFLFFRVETFEYKFKDYFLAMFPTRFCLVLELNKIFRLQNSCSDGKGENISMAVLFLK